MNSTHEAHDLAKKAVGKAAAELIQDGMFIGLGTGSTAKYFIESLIERCRNGLKISAVATSNRSAKQAKDGGIPIIEIANVTSLDMDIDGADEVDTKKRLIKGGGGALLREKIIASISREMIVIVDESKVVSQLGTFPLPIEIVPFAHHAILRKIISLGYDASFRHSDNGNLYITDNSNYIIDIKFPNPCANPEKDDLILRNIPGVVETGFFFNMAGRILIGRNDGTVIVKTE
jgi:ribose 5-phosphate isomerase A